MNISPNVIGTRRSHTVQYTNIPKYESQLEPPVYIMLLFFARKISNMIVIGKSFFLFALVLLLFAAASRENFQADGMEIFF